MSKDSDAGVLNRRVKSALMAGALADVLVSCEPIFSRSAQPVFEVVDLAALSPKPVRAKRASVSFKLDRWNLATTGDPFEFGLE